jgi:asparagine synthase (glutamine-hydrolysing)
MSGLAGAWNLDGAPVDRAILARMAAAVAHRGADYSGIHCSGPAGFASRVHRVTPESVAECQPVTDSAGNVVLFDGRLDNRTDLLATIGRREVIAGAPDSTLVLAAWNEWGEKFLGRLQGEFALALFDARACRLILARDAVGCRPLYYWTDGRRFVFGSEIKAVIAHPDVPAKPNENLLADFFLLERLPYDDGGETFFDGIQAVRPGSCLSVTPDATMSVPFWSFNARAQTRFRTHGDYAQRLRELLIAAVQRRLRTLHPVVVATSGGLDSAIVLSLADDLCKSGAASVSLLPVSYAAHDDPSSDENRFIALLEAERGLHVHRLCAGTPDDWAQLSGNIRQSELPVFDDGACAQAPLLAWAQAVGARTLLTGMWSDQLLFVTGYLTDLAMQLRWRQVARHMREYACWFPDADPAYFRQRFRRELLLNLTPRAVRGWIRPLHMALSRSQVRWPISEALANRLRRHRPPTRQPRYATVHARCVYQTVRSRSHQLQIEGDEKVAYGYGVEHVTPFLDRDVISYLMSIPGEILNHGGVPRALLRDAMTGIVPSPILGRRWPDESGTPAALDRDRRRMQLAARTQLHAARELGYLPDVRCADAASSDLVGLELWRRALFF